MQRSMAVQWPCMKQEVSQCPGKHNKAKLKSAEYMSNHKLDEVPVACTDERHRTNEARETVGSADGV